MSRAATTAGKKKAATSAVVIEDAAEAVAETPAAAAEVIQESVEIVLGECAMELGENRFPISHCPAKRANSPDCDAHPMQWHETLMI